MKRWFAIFLTLIELFSLLPAVAEEPVYVVAVIDTGVDYNHPDLKDFMWENHTSLPGRHGYDFINGDDDPMDDFGHGTHCAGVLLQECQRLGVPGRVEIMALKNMDENGSGLSDNAVAAYRYIIEAKQQGVNVVAVSNSWGITENPAALEEVIRQAGEMGIVSLCAAGNSAEDLDRFKTFPAGYDSPYTVIVACANDAQELATFSCYGKHDVDVAAPGTNMLSTYHKEGYLPTGEMAQDLFWDLTPDGGEPYEEGSGQGAEGNVRVYPFTAPLPSDQYVGIEYTLSAPADFFGICHVEVLEQGTWWRTGAFGLDNINFHSTKYFEVPAGTEALRLVCTGIDDAVTLHIAKLSVGASTGPYFALSGTSQATPKVAAEALWLQAQLPEASTEEIIARIIGGVDPLRTKGLLVSDGVINPEKALSDPNPVIVSNQLEGNTLTLEGYFFGEDAGSITLPEGCTLLHWSPRKITLELPTTPDEVLDIALTRADGATANQRLILRRQSQAWTAANSLPEPLAWSTAVACENMLYVIGGTRADDTTSNRMYRYDPATDAWTDCGTIATESDADFLQYGLTAVPYQGEIFLMAYDPMAEENRFFAYNPATESWQERTFSTLPTVTCNGTLAVYDNSLYLVGGIARTDTDTPNALWRLAEDGQHWHKVAELSTERFDALALQAGELLYIFGGKEGEN